MLNMTNETTRRAADILIEKIRRLAVRPIRLMEVCGTHTVAIFKAGIRQMLPPEIELVSGPGCPVCVTPNRYLDTAIAYSRQRDVIIASFGDMLRVPGSTSTLLDAKADGADIRIVYSPLDALELAKTNPDKQVIFLAVGFETTAPAAAATILTAEQDKTDNFYLLTAHKQVIPALTALLNKPHIHVDGFLLPGHVSAIIGLEPYGFLARQYNIPAVVAGFEALDILQSVAILAAQIKSGTGMLINQYKRVVRTQGNSAALSIMSKVYREEDAAWRGLGVIAASGLALKPVYSRYDALYSLPVEVERSSEPAGCRCGEVLQGMIKPTDCSLFATSCRPDNAVGACMVSVEGTCAAWYKYGLGGGGK